MVPPAILAILLLCLLPELVLTGADLGFWGDPAWRGIAIEYGGFWAGLLGNWRPNYAVQPWLMFVSYGFLHAGLLHFTVNMLTLLSLGRPLFAHYGGVRFVLLYLASLIGGAMGFGALGTVAAPMVGASGALFGLAGALMAMGYAHLIDRGASLWPIGKSALLLVALNVVIWWAMDGQLAWETHLGGFLAGWVFATFVGPSGQRPMRA